MIEAVPEVAFAHPMTYSSVELNGEKYVWGLPAVNTYDAELIAGRWYTVEEDAAAARVVVVGEATANQNGIEVGDSITVESRGGPLELEVVGIDGQLVNDGQELFITFNTVLDYEGRTTGNWWVRTVDRDPATVDAAAAAIHQSLEPHGYQLGRAAATSIASRTSREPSDRHRDGDGAAGGGDRDDRSRQRHREQRARPNSRDRHPAQHRSPPA